MKVDSRTKAEKFWDRTASNYDKEEKKDGKIYLQLINKLKTYLQPGHSVLDYACGTGLVSNEIAGMVKNIHAIDFSFRMIEIAKVKAQKQKIQNIEYIQASIFDDRLKLGSYDVIMAFYIFHLIETPAVIKRIHGLLKPGGILIAVTPCMGGYFFLRGLFSVAGKLGILPSISFFKRNDIEKMLINESFELIENSCLSATSNQYFSVSQK